MALPILQYRKDMIVMADWDTPVSDTATYDYKTWCGATSISLSVDNAVQETTVTDCDDWSLPAVVIAAYGAQTVSATVNAFFNLNGRDQLLDALLDQRELPIRFHLTGATPGKLEYLDGVGLITGSLENIGSSGDGQDGAISYTLNVRFKNGIERTLAA